MVNLIGGQRGRRVTPEVIRISLAAAWKPPQSGGVGRLTPLLLQERDRAPPGRIDVGADDALRLRAQRRPPLLRRRPGRGQPRVERRDERILTRRRRDER